MSGVDSPTEKAAMFALSWGLILPSVTSRASRNAPVRPVVLDIAFPTLAIMPMSLLNVFTKSTDQFFMLSIPMLSRPAASVNFSLATADVLLPPSPV